jgi:Protein of unknown function (DUF2971)
VNAPLLWHYTGFDGLRGIITKGELFASSLAYLNDTAEFQYTLDPLTALLDEMGLTLGDLARGLLYENVPSMVKAIFGHSRGQGLYVTCFSKERDDLSQWRSYTPQPPGFAIGFQLDELNSLVESFEFTLLECRYPNAEQLRAEVKATLDTATTGMKDEKAKLPMPTRKQMREDFTDKWAFKIVAAIIALAPQNKHPKFVAEREVRLLCNVSEAIGAENRFTVEYRLSGSLVVPHIRIPARPKEGPSPIKEILVGPCPHQEAVIAATQQMCVQHHVRAQIIPSAIPYRNW